MWWAWLLLGIIIGINIRLMAKIVLAVLGDVKIEQPPASNIVRMDVAARRLKRRPPTKSIEKKEQE